MSAETDLLPLPRTLRHPDDADLAEHVKAYARANLAELQREVEGLREYKRVSDECNESLRTFVKVEEARTAAAEARAERLAGALRGMMAEYEALHARHDLGECQATVDARAALDQETTNG